MAELSADRVAELRATVLGPVLTPDDSGYDKPSPYWVGGCTPRYDDARKQWNGLVDRHPAAIVQCQTVSDIQAALAFAQANDLAIAVRGGGHGPFGAATLDDGLVIDLTRLRGVHVDTQAQTAVAGAGCLLAELDRETQVHGLATTAGTVSHTGIAGLTLYGGVGRLMRKHGLTVDNVLAFDVVTADGRTLHVDGDNHPDLFWALRGGGAAFVIVTHFHYQLHPVGPIVHGGYLGWPIAQAKEVYLAQREHLASTPDDFQYQYIMVNAPDAEFIPEELRGQPSLMMTATYVGADLEEGKRVLAPLQELVPPLLNLVGDFPYTFLQAASDALAPHGRLSVAASCGYLEELTEEIVDLAIDEAGRFPSRFTVIEFSQMGGATRTGPPEGTPLDTARDAGFFYILAATTEDPDATDTCAAWNVAAAERMDPYRLPGRYLNFVSDSDEGTLRAAYGDAIWARLQDVKATYDPDGVFAYNPNAVAQTA